MVYSSFNKTFKTLKFVKEPNCIEVVSTGKVIAIANADGSLLLQHRGLNNPAIGRHCSWLRLDMSGIAWGKYHFEVGFGDRPMLLEKTPVDRSLGFTPYFEEGCSLIRQGLLQINPDETKLAYVKYCHRKGLKISFNNRPLSRSKAHAALMDQMKDYYASFPGRLSFEIPFNNLTEHERMAYLTHNS